VASAFFYTNYRAIGQWKPAYGEFGGPWYEYEGSIWRTYPGEVRTGIEWASRVETRLGYAFHFLVGHHGVFSLTPVWVLAVVGAVAGTRDWAAGRGKAADERTRQLRLTAALTLVVTVVVTGFYLFLAQKRWNYGGWTSGPRWLIWLTPLWLVCLVPVADRLGGRRWGRLLGYLLLGVSVLSASYPAWNPWRHPWLYNLMEHYGLLGY
jgi:hypothetical protein